jgi:hypothetical protein
VGKYYSIGLEQPSTLLWNNRPLEQLTDNPERINLLKLLREATGTLS